MSHEISQRFFFEAAHTLQREVEAPGSARVHGHTYQAEVSVQGIPDARTGMVMDIALLRSRIEAVRAQLDHHLLEFATALPDHLRRNGGQGKYLLKKLMERYLPREIIYRKKQGFPVPIAIWFRGPLYERVCEILLDSRTLSRGYFEPDYIRHVIQRHRAGAEDLSRRIFSLIALELWHRKYVD